MAWPSLVYRDGGEQLRWLPKIITNTGEQRVVIGDFMEEIAAHVLGARRLGTRAGIHCPDLEWNGQTVECKSIGAHRQARVQADRAPDWYLFVLHHASPGTLPMEQQALRECLAANLDGIVLVKRAITQRYPVRTLRVGAGRVWNVVQFGKQHLTGLMQGQTTMWFGGSVYGHQVPAIPLYGMVS